MLPSGPTATDLQDINLSAGFPSDESRIDPDKRSTSDQTSDSIGLRQRDAAKTPLPVSDEPASTVTAHTAPASAARSVTESPVAQIINTEPQKIADGVFIGEGRAKSGEKFFLKMERIHAANRQHWSNYALATYRLTRDSRSLMEALIKTTKKSVAADGTIRHTNENYDALAPLLGMSREEFLDLVHLLGKRGLSSAPEDRPRRTAIFDISAGAGHIILDEIDECYVIYASKTENFQIPLASEFDASSAPPTLKEYIRLYGDLLMCTGANFSWENGFHSKGTFRNPYNAIENTYKGLAMILRGFTGAVAKKYFPGKQSLFVQPLASMQYMISSALQADDYSVRHYSHDEALRAAKEALLDGDNFEMPMNTIKVSALDRLYRGHASA